MKRYLALVSLLLVAFLPVVVYAQHPAPPPVGSGPESYVIYALIAVGSIVVTTGGQLAVALVKWREQTTAAELPASFPLTKAHATQIEQSHKALHWTDTEGVQRPILSGVIRSQEEDARKEVSQLLVRLVENSERQTDLLARLVDHYDTLPCVRESGDEGERG